MKIVQTFHKYKVTYFFHYSKHFLLKYTKLFGLDVAQGSMNGAPNET